MDSNKCISIYANEGDLLTLQMEKGAIACSEIDLQALVDTVCQLDSQEDLDRLLEAGNLDGAPGARTTHRREFDPISDETLREWKTTQAMKLGDNLTLWQQTMGPKAWYAVGRSHGFLVLSYDDLKSLAKCLDNWERPWAV